MKVFSNGTTTYYRYRKDDSCRLQLIRSSWISGKNVLDIGCNSGNLTMEIARQYCPRLIEAIDIDHKLIQTAKERQDAMIRNEDNASTSNIKRIKLRENPSSSFIPRALAKRTSSITIPVRPIVFPRNVLFKSVDIVSPEPIYTLSRSKYDTILCLSVTKWVQLNAGDDGLRLLFDRAFNLLVPNGMFVLEYQPWKSYVKNRNSSQQTKEIFPTLKIRPEDFESILISIGFIIDERLGTSLSEAKGFSRPFLVLKKPSLFLPENKVDADMKKENCLFSHKDIIEISNDKDSYGDAKKKCKKKKKLKKEKRKHKSENMIDKYEDSMTIPKKKKRRHSKTTGDGV